MTTALTTAMFAATADAEPKAMAHPPGTIDTAYVQALKEYAEVMFKGGVAGKDVKRWEEAAAKIELGRRVGLNPFMSLANIAVIHGRPTIWGDAALALIRSKGVLEDIEETFEGEGDGLTAVCRVKRVGAKRDRVQRYSVADAKRAKLWDKKDLSKGDGPWQTNPRRQLMFRARSFVLRDEFGDVLSGMILTEEALDYPAEPRDAVPVAVVTVSPPAASKPTAAPAPSLPPATPTPPAGPRVRPEEDPAATRDSLMVRLAELRETLLTGRGITDEAEAVSAWAGVVQPLGVQKASQLDDAKLRAFIVTLAREYDPF